MPGISLIKGEFVERETENESVNKNDEIIHNAIKLAIYNESYTIKILLKSKSLLIAYTGYPEYPITVFEDDHFWICIEGKIYGKDYGVLRNELDILLNDIFDTPEQVPVKKNGVVDNWLSTTDGEFIIYALNKKNKDFIVVNDVLGRLPLYYYYNDDYTKIIISREMQIVSSLIGDHGLIKNSNSNRLDRVAIAQYLLFGFILGSRTLLTNVYRLKPATLIRIYSQNTKLTISCLYTFNFDNKRYASDDIKSNVDKLVLLFTEACKNRAASKGKNNIVSLSGGFDSRCVAACLFENKVPFSAVTYVQPGWAPAVGSSSEVEVAKQLANNFECELENYGLIEPEARDFVMLLRIKFGLNYLEFGYILPLLEKLKQQYHGSEIVFFTGDGGDRLLPGLKPSKKLKSLEDLVDDILDRFGSIFFSKNDVAAITQIKEGQIVEELRKILSSYPEKKLDQKFVHFMMYEAVFNDLFESEDRNRAYFWSVSPYYSVPFFDYAMSCSDGIKSHSRLQKKFLVTLSPSAAAIDKAEYDCSILSKRYKLIEFIISMEQRYPTLRKVIGKIRRNKDHKDNSKTIKCLKDQLFSCESIGSYFVRDRLDYILNNPKKFNPSGISVLFTIISLVETVFCNQSSIKKYFV